MRRFYCMYYNQDCADARSRVNLSTHFILSMLILKIALHPKRNKIIYFVTYFRVDDEFDFVANLKKDLFS